MTVLPSPSEQVRYESGVRTKFAGLAFAAGILTVAFLLLQEVGSHGKVAEETVQLLNYHQRFPLDIVGAVLDAIGLLCTAVMLGWLARISRAREPSLQKIPSYLVMVGAPLMAICQLVEIVVISIKANSFATSGAQTYPQAYNLVHSVTGLLNADDNLLRPLGMLLLAVGFVWIVMNAMKVGLLPRPLGYAGVVAGAMEIFQIGPISFVIQGVWLVVVAVLLAGRWPQGTPPAWEEGIAIPWLPGGVPDRENSGPGGADRAAAERKAAAGQRGAKSAEARAAAAPQAPTQSEDYTPRRKKKKR